MPLYYVYDIENDVMPVFESEWTGEDYRDFSSNYTDKQEFSSVRVFESDKCHSYEDMEGGDILLCRDVCDESIGYCCIFDE